MRQAVFWGLLMVSSLSIAGCESDTETGAARPVAPPGPTPAIDGGGPAPDGGGPPGECTSFATENERLLNAPTASVPIKKKVTLPPP